MIEGNYIFENVASRYGGNKALEFNQLRINAGEKIGVLGPLGGSKSTLLRVLSGIYKPQEGRILLDDMALSHISMPKPKLAEHIGYLQQDIFAGGKGLSGGQRRLVNLTRVFLRQPDILLFDESSVLLAQRLPRSRSTYEIV